MKAQKIISAIVFYGFLVGFFIVMPIYEIGLMGTLRMLAGFVIAVILAFLVFIAGSILFDEK